MTTSTSILFGKCYLICSLLLLTFFSACKTEELKADPDDVVINGVCQYPIMKSLDNNQLPAIAIGDIKALGQTSSFVIFGYSFLPKTDGQISKIGLRLPENNLGTEHTVRLYDTDLFNQVPLGEALVTPVSSSSFNYVDLDPVMVSKDTEYMVCVYMPVIAAEDQPLTQFFHITDISYPFTIDDIIINGYAYDQDLDKVKPEPKGSNSIILNGFVDICFQPEE